MRWTLFALANWVALADFAVGLVVQRGDDPSPEDLKAMQKAKAKEYMKQWKSKSWDTSKRSCDTDKLPKTTDEVIHRICGSDAQDGDKCVCNLAKAHSCHAGCRLAGRVCPAECSDSVCAWGDPANGGLELSNGGSNGKCYAFCSAPWENTRYCGRGPAYESGLALDCSGCAPGRPRSEMTAGEKKHEWTKCMTNCLPTPSCIEMCGEGTPDCNARCVQNYKSVVEPYWDIFKGTLSTVPLLRVGDQDTSQGASVDSELPQSLNFHARRVGSHSAVSKNATEANTQAGDVQKVPIPNDVAYDEEYDEELDDQALNFHAKPVHGHTGHSLRKRTRSEDPWTFYGR